jgi:hypothetical protein
LGTSFSERAVRPIASSVAIDGGAYAGAPPARAHLHRLQESTRPWMPNVITSKLEANTEYSGLQNANKVLTMLISCSFQKMEGE